MEFQKPLLSGSAREKLKLLWTTTNEFLHAAHHHRVCVRCAKPSRWWYLASSYIWQAATIAFSKLALRIENQCDLPSANLKRHWYSRLRIRRHSTNSPSRNSKTLGCACISASMVRCLLVLAVASSIACGDSAWRSIIEPSPAAWQDCAGRTSTWHTPIKKSLCSVLQSDSKYMNGRASRT